MKELSILDAFRALNEVEEKIDSEIPIKKKNVPLEEGVNVDLNSTKEVEAARELLNEKEDTPIEVIDVNADTLEHIKNNEDYIGQMILKCRVCQALKFIDTNNLVVSEDDEELFNIEDECPNCHAEGKGFELVGQVGKVVEEEPVIANDEKNSDEPSFDNDAEPEQAEEKTEEEQPAESEPEEEPEIDSSIDEPKEKDFNETDAADDTEDLDLPKFGDLIDADDVPEDDTVEKDEKVKESLEEEEPEEEAEAEEEPVEEAEEESEEEVEEERQPLTIQSIIDAVAEPEKIKKIRIVDNSEDAKVVFEGVAQDILSSMAEKVLVKINPEGLIFNVESEDVDGENLIDFAKDIVPILDVTEDNLNKVSIVVDGEDVKIEDVEDLHDINGFVTSVEPVGVVEFVVEASEDMPEIEEEEKSDEDKLVSDIFDANNLSEDKKNNIYSNEYWINESIKTKEDLDIIFESFILNTDNAQLIKEFKAVTGFKDALDEAREKLGYKVEIVESVEETCPECGKKVSECTCNECSDKEQLTEESTVDPWTSMDEVLWTLENDCIFSRYEQDFKVISKSDDKAICNVYVYIHAEDVDVTDWGYGSSPENNVEDFIEEINENIDECLEMINNDGNYHVEEIKRDEEDNLEYSWEWSYRGEKFLIADLGYYGLSITFEITRVNKVDDDPTDKKLDADADTENVEECVDTAESCKYCKDRKELAEAIIECQNNNRPYSVKRSSKEGYRYELIPEAFFDDEEDKAALVPVESDALEGEVLDDIPETDETALVADGASELEIEATQNIMRVAQDTVDAVKEYYGYDAPAELVAADIMQDLRLISGDVDINDLEDSPINNATKELFKSYEDFYEVMDEITSWLTGESFHTTPEEKLTQALQMLNGPQFSTENIYKAIGSDRFVDAVQHGVISYIPANAVQQIDGNVDESLNATEEIHEGLMDKIKAIADGALKEDVEESNDEALEEDEIVDDAEEDAIEAEIEVPEEKASESNEVLADLIIDEKEAIEGYKEAVEELSADGEITDKAEEVLKHIEEEELEHVEELSKVVAGDEDEIVTEELNESTTPDEMKEITKLANEIGLKTTEDLRDFVRREAEPDESPLDALRRYRAELGDDFKLKDGEMDEEFDEVTFDSDINEYFDQNYEDTLIYATESGEKDASGNILLEGYVKSDDVTTKVNFLLEPIGNNAYKVTNNLSDETFEFTR